MSEKAKAMMERLKNNSTGLENGKPDPDVCCIQFSTIAPKFNSSTLNRFIFLFIFNQEERQARLLNNARRLIAETRARSMNLDSPTSPVKSITHRITLSPERTISPINNADGFAFTSNKSSNSKENSPSKTKSNHSSSPRITPPRDVENNHSNSPNQNIVFSEKNGNSPTLQSFNSVLESLTPQHDKKVKLRIEVRL